MKRFGLLAMLFAIMFTSTGCCLMDNMICRRHAPAGCGSCGMGCDNGCDTACDECGVCDGRFGNRGGWGCNSCRNGMGGRGMFGGRNGHHPGICEGGGAGFVTYPYYTHRGPRDFLNCNPGFPSN